MKRTLFALSLALGTAATARVLHDYNRALSDDCLDIARKVYRDAQVGEKSAQNKLQAAAELYLTTGEQEYLDYIIGFTSSETTHSQRGSAFGNKSEAPIGEDGGERLLLRHEPLRSLPRRTPSAQF